MCSSHRRALFQIVVVAVSAYLSAGCAEPKPTTTVSPNIRLPEIMPLSDSARFSEWRVAGERKIVGVMTNRTTWQNIKSTPIHDYDTTVRVAGYDEDGTRIPMFALFKDLEPGRSCEITLVSPSSDLSQIKRIKVGRWDD